MANRACTTARAPDRETVRSRIHTAAIRVCADRSQSNRLPQFERIFPPCSPPDSTPAQNTRRTPRPRAREIQISRAISESPATDPLIPSRSFPSSPLPFRRCRPPAVSQARSGPSARARHTRLFQTAIAALRRFVHVYSAPGRSPQSCFPDATAQPPTTLPGWPSSRRRTNVQEILSIRTSPRFPRQLPFPASRSRVRHPARDCSD